MEFIGDPNRRNNIDPWSKAMPSASESYTPFSKQPLACYKVVVEIEHLTIRHQVNMWPDLPITF